MRRINALLLNEQDEFVREFQKANSLGSLDETINVLIGLFEDAPLSSQIDETTLLFERIKSGELVNETEEMGLS